MEYTKGRKYRSLVAMLKYIQPLINDDVETLINDFRKKSKQKHVSAKEYKKNVQILQNYLDKIEPVNLPPLSDKFKQIQKNTLEISKEIIEDIQKNTNIKMWFGGGSLLGAVRHKGFIPWDDDMDFAMLREDYKKFEKYVKDKYITIDTSNWTKKTYSREIKKYVKQYENQIIVVKTFDAFKLIKGTPKNFAIVDFFVWDYFNDYHNVRTLQKYCDSIKAEMDKIDTYDEIFKLYDRELNNGIDIVSKSDVLAPGIDNHGFISYDRKEIVRHSDIFPLTKIKFEDCEFKAPNNSHIYLKSLYDFYNKIPLDGLKITAHVNVKGLSL